MIDHEDSCDWLIVIFVFDLQEIAVKIVQTILRQDAKVGSLEKSDMLLDFIAPLLHDTEGVEEDDDEVGSTNIQCADRTCCPTLSSIWDIEYQNALLAICHNVSPSFYIHRLQWFCIFCLLTCTSNQKLDPITSIKFTVCKLTPKFIQLDQS